MKDAKLTPKEWLDVKLDLSDRLNDNQGDTPKTKADEDGKYIRTPWTLCEEIVSEIARTIKGVVSQDIEDSYLYQDALKGKKILVVDTVEFIPVLLAFGAEKCNITYVAPYEYKGAMIAGVIGVRVVQQSLLDWKPDMKFDVDVVVGNPPYNKGMLKGANVKAPGGYPHLYFIDKCKKYLKPEGCLSFVMPTGLMTLHSLGRYRSQLLKDGHFKEITIYNNSKKKYFDIDKFDNVMSFLYINGCQNNSQTRLRRENFQYEFNETTVDLSAAAFWPLYFDKTSQKIFEKVQKKKIGHVPYLKGEETDNYIAFAVMGDSNSLVHTKLWKLNDFNPDITALVKLFFSSPEEVRLYYEFTQTKFYNFLLCMVKSTPKNQPQFIGHIGRFDFTDTDFFRFFDLNQEEIDYIEAIVK